MEQNTNEWYKLRNYKMGASDSNVVMGKSRFMTPLQLWKLKTGREKHKSIPNFICEKGHRLEEQYRNLIEIEYDTEFPSVVFVSKDIDFLMASLDGYSKELNVNWECKLVGKDKFQDIELVKKEYYAQIQQQLLLSGADYCILTCLYDDKSNIQKKDLKVYPDEEYIKSELLPAVIGFWDCVKNDTPPKLNDMDVVDLSDNEKLSSLLEEYVLTKNLVAEYKAKEDKLKKEIFKISKTKKASCNGFKITWSKSEDKKVFDHKKFELDNEISEDYLKVQKGRKTQRITEPKQGE